MMKAKEKGIDQKTLHRGNTPGTESGRGTAGDRSGNRPPPKFNAFREMEKLRQGGTPMLATIPDSVAVVGTPLNPPGRGQASDKGKSRDQGNTLEKGKKRDREDGEGERPGKSAKTEVGVLEVVAGIRLTGPAIGDRVPWGQVGM